MGFLLVDKPNLPKAAVFNVPNGRFLPVIGSHTSISPSSIILSLCQKEERLVGNDILIHSGVKCGSDKGCQAPYPRVCPIEVGVVFALPVTLLNTNKVPGQLHTPRTVEKFFTAFMELDALSIKFLFNDEGFPLHLFDTFLEFSGSPAEHRGEGPEQLRSFALRIVSGARKVWTEISYLISEPFIWVPQTPGDFFQVGTGIIQVLRVWMKHREYSCIFYRYCHVFIISGLASGKC